MIEYDSSVVNSAAQDLMRQRLEVKIVRTINHLALGLIVGIGVALILALVPSESEWQRVLTPDLVITASILILGGIGFLRAVEESKELRFRAHMLLCQARIEQHLARIVERQSEHD